VPKLDRGVKIKLIQAVESKKSRILNPKNGSKRVESKINYKRTLH